MAHKYIRNVLAALRKADRDFSLIDSGDRILVGVSGGKDSLALLYALSLYGKFAKKDFMIAPVFLDLGFPSSDLSSLKAFCSSIGTPLEVNDSRFVYDVLKAHTKEGHHIPCSICSRMKKAAMNSIAKEKGYNKVAFAHHIDDAIETLFMNMVHGGRVATFEPKMHLDRANITFIRPLVYCKEGDLRALCEEEGLPVLESHCPANGFTEREWTKEFLADIYKSHPEAHDNFRGLLTNYEAFQLFFSDIEWENENDHSFALKPVISPNDARETHFISRKAKPGEKNFLILHHHKKEGEISYRPLSDHKIEIFGLYGNKEASIKGIDTLLNRVSKSINPLTVYLSGVRKDIANEAGFEKKEDPFFQKGKYLLYIKK